MAPPANSILVLPMGAGSLREVLQASAWTWLGLIFAILALAWIVARVRSWFREDADPAESANRLLSEIREMYEQGELSEEEFRSIKGRLTKPNDPTTAAAED